MTPGVRSSERQRGLELKYRVKSGDGLPSQKGGGGPNKMDHRLKREDWGKWESEG